jgi:hypothetical protein
MFFALIPPRLHGWLDDLVALTYLAGWWWLGLTGLAAAVAWAGAIAHFLLTRFTDYPQGTWKLIPFRTHAFIELGEGLLVLAATWLLVSQVSPAGRAFLTFMGATQLVAFAFSDYGRAAPVVAP